MPKLSQKTAKKSDKNKRTAITWKCKQRTMTDEVEAKVFKGKQMGDLRSKSVEIDWSMKEVWSPRTSRGDGVLNAKGIMHVI